jgi:hypothetical protein
MFHLYIKIAAKFLQGTQLKDIKIPADAATSLLLEKHAEYIAAYGNKKDDYVMSWSKFVKILAKVHWNHTLPPPPPANSIILINTIHSYSESIAT